MTKFPAEFKATEIQAEVHFIGFPSKPLCIVGKDNFHQLHVSKRESGICQVEAPEALKTHHLPRTPSLGAQPATQGCQHCSGALNSELTGSRTHSIKPINTWIQFSALTLYSLYLCQTELARLLSSSRSWNRGTTPPAFSRVSPETVC